MKVLGERAAARPDRAASMVVHDEPNLRIVSFHLLPGQRIPPHRSASTVSVQVVRGTGTFRGAEDEAVLGPGEGAVFAPGETHAIEAADGPLEFLALIAPRPGG
ncbi:MAG TPA: cupin domain-containing protein [Longimicrobiales bacterium]